MYLRASCLAFLVVALASGQASAGTILKGPWLQNVKRGGITVVWEASESEIVVPSVEYGATDAYGLGSVSATYEAVDGHHVYTARITGLSAGTIYHYRVSSGSTVTTDATFRTSPFTGTTGFRFYAVGDSRTNMGVWATIANLIHADMAEYPEHHQSFLLHLGDVVDDGGVYADWDQLWRPARYVASELPVYVAFGNHEDVGTASSEAYLYGYFDFPYSDSGSTDEKWYSFTYGNAHMTALALYDDVGFISGAQFDWMSADLAAADADTLVDWIFPFLHFLPWSLGHHLEAEAADQRTYLHPVFRDENVDCAFGGHNHAYARYLPVGGVTYVTSGGGGAALSGPTYTPWAGATLAHYANVHHYLAVDVEEEVAAVRAVDITGDVIDWVTLGGTSTDLPPFAHAGADQRLTGTSTVTLDGRGSTDPEGASLTYEWSQVSGPSVTLSSTSADQPTFTPPGPARYVFKLRVNDGTYWSAPDFTLVTVIDGVLTFNPVADAYVNSLYATTNYGTETVLLYDSDPEVMHVYLRFDVSGTLGEIESATLRMYCFNEGDPGDIYVSTDTSWDEATVTWSSPVAADGPLVGSISATVVDTWAVADVTRAVAGDGLVTLVILPTSTNGVDFRSRESPDPPELIVTYMGVEPQEPTCSFITDITDIHVGDTVTFSATASDPDGGSIASYEWDFDYDGATFAADATGDEVTHSYDTDGTYTAALLVTDDEEQTCLSTRDLTVTLPVDEEEEPVAEEWPEGEDVATDATDDGSTDMPVDPVDEGGGESSGCGCAIVA
jgi:plastocyanin